MITAYRSPVPVSRQASNIGPRQPGQMPNENSGNAARNRTSSARIHDGAARLPYNSDLLSSARPQSYQCASTAPSASSPRAGGASFSPAATGSARLPDLPGALAFHTRTPHALGLAAAQRPDRPRPPRTVELPPVAAAGQADIVPVIITAHAATIHDISLRTHYTRGSHSEMARKLLIAPSHTGAGARHRSKERHASKRIRPSGDTPRLLGTPRRLPGPAQARHRRPVPAAVPVHRAQPDAHRDRSRLGPGPDQRDHQRHPQYSRRQGLRAHRRRPRHARPRPAPARAISAPDPCPDALAQQRTGQFRTGRRPAPADHRGRSHRWHRRPCPAGRNRQHPAPGPPPRCACRRGQAGSPHRPHRDQPAVLPAPRQPPATRPGPGRRLRASRMAGHRHEPPDPCLGPFRACHRRCPRSR